MRILFIRNLLLKENLRILKNPALKKRWPLDKYANGID